MSVGKRRKKPEGGRFEGRLHQVGIKLLLAAIDTFDAYQIQYQVDYGTLLGLVRDGDLIPWDGDIDISVPASQIRKLRRVLRSFLLRGWFVRCVTMNNDCRAWRPRDVRVVKIKSGAIPYVWPGGVLLDVFIRYPYDDFHWWSTCGYVCRAATSYFEGCETIEFANRSVRVPQNCEQYLTEVYGDWRTPNPDFRATDDGTIVRPIQRTSK